MERCREKEKLNNAGFSLIEVLIAMVILCVVSIPLLHSFVTTARTNAKAKILLKATDCAENIMEQAEYLTVDELIETYSVNAGNSINETDGRYEFYINNPDDFPVKLPEGYRIEMILNPNLYPNANALNLADVKSISITDTAVYEMPALYDSGIYGEFDEWNRVAHEDQGLLYQRADSGYFKENLTRTMEITVNKKGTDTDEGGNTIDLVTVNLDIRYYFRNKNQYKDYLPNKQKEYVETTKELFNNLSTKEPLNGIFIFYQPRYLATASGNADNIIINNKDNVPVNVILAAQQGAADASYKAQYFNIATGPNVTVVENPVSAINATDAVTTLFTNLSEGAPYSAINAEGTPVADGEMLCRLSYQNPAGTQKVTGADAVAALDARDLNGKALQADSVKKRIYKMIVTVKDNTGNEVVELDGTKLQ